MKPYLSAINRDIQIDAETGMWAFYMLNQVNDKPHCIGKQIDANGVEQEVWQYPMSWLDAPRVSSEPRNRHFNKLNKLKRRQRRAVQRRHNNHRYNKGNK